MRMVIVAIRDRASDMFGNPIFVAARGQAIRNFQDEVNRVAENNPLNSHPEDFDLYELGSFDTSDGSFDCSAGPRMIAVGKDMAHGRA